MDDDVTTAPSTSSASSGDTPTTATSDFGLDAESKHLSDAIRDYVSRVRSGDVGSLPGIAAFLGLCLMFALSRDSFFTNINLANLLQQAAWLIVLAMGVTFVLLLGEIDLSIGATMGVTVAYVYTQTNSGVATWLSIVLSAIVGGVLGLTIARQSRKSGVERTKALGAGVAVGVIVFAALATVAPNTMMAVILGMVVGSAMGLFTGVLVARVGIPSFVVTLALFLAWQGWLQKIAKEGGSISVQDDFLVAIGTKSMSPTLGWVMFAVVVLGFLGFSLNQRRSRIAKGAAAQSVDVILAKTAALALLWGFATYQLNQNRAFANATKPLEGVPYVVPVILVITVAATFMLNRTAWGRHLYAVGGNAEAARRAGISVANIKMSAFAVAGFLASIAGIIYASRVGSVTPQTGAGSELLLAVGAAVVGGTSLFGGKGKVVNAVVGGLVLAVIDNGLGLFQKLFGTDVDAGFKLIAAATVLLIAGSIDALTRRGGNPSR
jgi:D-xylose transport system permease protein